jgi:hypothetical protein
MNGETADGSRFSDARHAVPFSENASINEVGLGDHAKRNLVENLDV